MKQQSSQPGSDYTLKDHDRFPFATLNEGARELGITPQRMSRLLRILEVPVHKRGYMIFLDTPAIKRIKKAIDRQEVKPGRKKSAP